MPQERFSEEASELTSRNIFLKSSTANSLRTQLQKISSAQQAWMNSRNQTNITSSLKHRQPVFRHPTVTTVGIGEIKAGRRVAIGELLSDHNL